MRKVGVRLYVSLGIIPLSLVVLLSIRSSQAKKEEVIGEMMVGMQNFSCSLLVSKNKETECFICN